MYGTAQVLPSDPLRGESEDQIQVERQWPEVLKSPERPGKLHAAGPSPELSNVCLQHGYGARVGEG